MSELRDFGRRLPRLHARRRATRLAQGLAALTARERQVVMRLLSGQTGKETAFDLGIAHATVRVLLARARARLGVSNQHELLALPAVQALRGPAL